MVFTVGFMLGTIRTLWLVPLVGERMAELAEAPLMLAAIFYSARFVTRRFPANRAADHIASGLFALGLLLLVEFTVVLSLRGLSIREYLAERDSVAGAVYLVMLVLFAAMPWLVGRRYVAGGTADADGSPR